jgi:hypothetical protein
MFLFFQQKQNISRGKIPRSIAPVLPGRQEGPASPRLMNGLGLGLLDLWLD